MGQVVLPKILDQAISLDTISHAYLFDVGNANDYMTVVNCFVKHIVCPFNYNSACGKGDCLICKQIDEGTYNECKIIEPDGNWIKKESLTLLQEEFSLKAISGKRRVYVIKEASKMNKYGSNALLKFLEEPCDDVVAILITSNREMLLPTIISRCQVVVLNNEDSMLDINLYDKVYRFICLLEDNNGILYVEDNWLDVIEDNFKALQLMMQIYNDALKILLEDEDITWALKKDDLLVIAKKNTVEKICYKIKKLVEYYDLLKYNVNVNLLIDRMVIEFGGELG